MRTRADLSVGRWQTYLCIFFVHLTRSFKILSVLFLITKRFDGHFMSAPRGWICGSFVDKKCINFSTHLTRSVRIVSVLLLLLLFFLIIKRLDEQFIVYMKQIISWIIYRIIEDFVNSSDMKIKDGSCIIFNDWKSGSVLIRSISWLSKLKLMYHFCVL